MTRRVVVSLSVVLVAGAVFVESRFSRARPTTIATEVAAPGALMIAPPKVRDAGVEYPITIKTDDAADLEDAGA